MERLCHLFDKSRQAWYKTTLAKESRWMKEMIIIEKVKRLRKELPRVGTEKLHICLKHFFRQHQIKMGRDKLHALLKEHRLIVPKYKRRTRTTNSLHRFKKYDNLTNYEPLTHPNTLWVSDITYVPIGGHFAYLSLITDAYSHKIVGWHLSPTLETKGPMKALEMALKQRTNKEHTLIHHSDRGIQYCSHAYVELLEENEIEISMTQNGDPYENAIAERINGIIKNEMIEPGSFFNFEEATRAIKRAIRNYNTLRPHRSCNMLTPEQAHCTSGELKKRWRNYYQLRHLNLPNSERHSHKPMPSGAPPLPPNGPITQAGKS
ncbi:MAG: IS3 family transposase [Bacteroidota bacterium]